ncbi:MAG TPA: hypothetical protein HPP87_10505 [Planctomycetes bacterium]|nr:hypothetical protein [Planctomycetota bacterium]
MDDYKIQSKCRMFINHAESSARYTDQRQRAISNQDFYRGHHWTEEQWNAYRDIGVEPITVNRCMATIKTMCGLQSQNKQDITVKPRHNGSETVAKVQTQVLKHTQDLAFADLEYAACFRKGCVETAGYLTWDIDPVRNPNGQITIKARGFFDVIVDPDASDYDLNKSAKYVMIQEFEDKEDIEARYPKIAEASFVEGETVEERVGALVDYLVGADLAEYDDQTGKYRYKMYYVYWKENIPAVSIYDTKTKQMAVLTDKKKIKQAKKKKNNDRYRVEDTVYKKLHRSVMLGKTLVEDVEDPFEHPDLQDYPVTRFVPYFDSGYCFGVLDNIISLNKEENINRTQATRYLNQTVNSGWLVNDGSNQTAMKQLEQYGSVNGLILDKSKYGGGLEKIKPNPISQGHMINAEQFNNDIKEVSGLNDAVHGYETGKVESGRALNIKQQQGLLSTESVFQNFHQTLTIFGNQLLKVIQVKEIYTKEEIRQVVEESDLIDTNLMLKAKNEIVDYIGTDLMPPNPNLAPPEGVMQMVKPEDVPMVYDQIKEGIQGAQLYAKNFPKLMRNYEDAIREYAIQLLLEEFYDTDTAEYGVKVTIGPNAPTTKMINYMMLSELQDKYGIIPPDIFIKATDLPNKDEIIQSMRQAQMAQQAQGVPA